MLPKQFRLRKRTEFAYSYKNGKRVHSENISLVIFARKDKLLRIGFSVSKKVGKAVERNKVKRRLRVLVSVNLSKMHRGYNLIFVAREEISKKTFEELKLEVNRLLQKNGLVI